MKNRAWLCGETWARASATLMIAASVAACDDDSQREPDYFLVAKVNGMDWSADKDLGIAQLQFDEAADGYFLWLRSEKQDPLPDGVRYHIEINVNQPVAVARFPFDPNGPGTNFIGGDLADIYGWRKNGTEEPFRAMNLDGFIQITGLTKTDITGIFEFTAAGSGTDTIQVTEGKFNLPITVPFGRAWEGP